MKNNVNIKVSVEDCCGCGACANKCGVQAITMQENNEGFLYPVINEASCVECGQCLKVCPVLNAKSTNFEEPKCYAVMANDEIRAKSSSGGMFTLLAEYILKQGGVVCGAAFDEKWNVHHIIVDNRQDLEKLRGSKYVQSNTENCYTEIQKLLKGGKPVLFSGTPCQVAGLYTFLGRKYDNLLTVDVLCHGAPSRGVWQKYLAEEFANGVTDVNFRDKEQIGWSCSSCTITTSEEKKVVSDDYTKLFHKSIILNQTCAHCKYSKLPRPADITLGDWWGISKHIEGLNDGKGLSFVLINSDKGEEAFAQIKSSAQKITPIKMHNDYNNGNIRRDTPHSPAREIFFKNWNKMPVSKAVKLCLQNKYDAALTCIWYGSNYGSILVSYSCYKILQNLGLSVLMLDKPKFIWNENAMQQTIARQFGCRYYNVSRVYNSMEDMIYLNQFCDNFVLGSDQMFNPRLKLEHSFMEYVYNQKNKIAFGPSFGHDNYNVDEETLRRHRYLIKRFNHIALREKSDNLCHKIFDIEAEEIIDPSLICPREDFEKLADNDFAKLNFDISQPYLLTYMLDLNPEKVEAIKWVAEKLNLQIINIQNLDKRQRKNLGLEYLADYTPEQFLKLYKNASFVVTDSYHGTCFSVKFNRPFISIVNTGRGKLRYKMFKMLEVSERIVDNPHQVYERPDLLQAFDFTKTNAIIAQKAKFATDWLQNALKNNTSAQKFSDAENYMDMQLKSLALKFCEYKTIGLIARQIPLMRKYHYYKVMSIITWGKRRQRYKNKYNELKPTIKKLRQMNEAI